MLGTLPRRSHMRFLSYIILAIFTLEAYSQLSKISIKKKSVNVYTSVYGQSSDSTDSTGSSISTKANPLVFVETDARFFVRNPLKNFSLKLGVDLYTLGHGPKAVARLDELYAEGSLRNLGNLRWNLGLVPETLGYYQKNRRDFVFYTPVYNDPMKLEKWGLVLKWSRLMRKPLTLELGFFTNFEEFPKNMKDESFYATASYRTKKFNAFVGYVNRKFSELKNSAGLGDHVFNKLNSYGNSYLPFSFSAGSLNYVTAGGEFFSYVRVKKAKKGFNFSVRGEVWVPVQQNTSSDDSESEGFVSQALSFFEGKKDELSGVIDPNTVTAGFYLFPQVSWKKVSLGSLFTVARFAQDTNFRQVWRLGVKLNKYTQFVGERYTGYGSTGENTPDKNGWSASLRGNFWL